MSTNGSLIIANHLPMIKSISDVLNGVTQNFIDYLPLVFTILGFIGFVGNAFTYLQRELRSNTCCIYSLCGSIADVINLFLNLLPNFLGFKYGIYIPWYSSSFMCKLSLFVLVFIPHLSINFLLMAIIDRFACTCNLASPIRRLNQPKMVPFVIIFAILTSCLASIYAPLLNDLEYGWCLPTNPMISTILYIVVIGLMPPIAMLIFVLLTYRNVRLSRRRVGGTNAMNTRDARKQFIVMIFAQIVSTAFFALQWIIMYMYFSLAGAQITDPNQSAIVFFVFSLSNNVFYLNNVKAFYISMLTSSLFRKTFFKGLIDLLPRKIRPQFHFTDTNASVATVTKIKRGNTTRR